jgi:hypothetical protein
MEYAQYEKRIFVTVIRTEGVKRPYRLLIPAVSSADWLNLPGSIKIDYCDRVFLSGLAYETG